MGIPKFAAGLKKKYHASFFPRLNARSDSLLLDFNSLLYQAAGRAFEAFPDKILKITEDGNYQVSDPHASINRMAQTLFRAKSTEDLYNEFFTQLLEIINNLLIRVNPQQALVIAVDGVPPAAKIQQQRKRRYVSGLTKPKDGFDRNSFTPGTDYMAKIDQSIQELLLSVDGPFRQRFPNLTLFYSSSFKVGEGEHKLMDLIKTDRFPNQLILIDGMDADLIILSLLLEQENVFLLREDQNNLTHYINVDSLRKQILDDFGTPSAIEDFMVISFFFGNDFLPRSAFLSDFDIFLVEAVKAYKNSGSQALYVDSKIQPIALADFLGQLKFAQQAFIRRLGAGRLIAGSIVLEYSTDGKFEDYSEFRTAWYRKIFRVDPTEDMINELCWRYLVAFDWIGRYYTLGGGSVDQRSYFPYFGAPLWPDFEKFLRQTALMPETTVVGNYFTDQVQLLAVLPPSSKTLIPKRLQKLTSDSKSELYDLYPSRFVFDFDGKLAPHEATPLIPFASVDRIESAIARLNKVKRSKVKIDQDIFVEYPAIQTFRRPVSLFSPDQYRGRGRGGGRDRGESRGRGRGDFRGRGRGESRGQSESFDQDESRGRGRNEFRGRSRGREDFRGQSRGHDRGRAGTGQSMPADIWGGVL